MKKILFIAKKNTGETGTGLIALGGLTSAFGAAACCALPIALGMAGLGSAWLGSIALVTAPYQSILLWIALFSVGIGLFLTYRRPAIACEGQTCAPRSSYATKIALWLGAALIILTLMLSR